MRLVLDTNVLISAIFWGGKPRIVLELATIKHTLCFTKETIGELQEVLGYTKFEPHIRKLSFSIEEFLKSLFENAVIVSDFPQLSVIQEDPSDNKFLACALAAHASFIISGDAHLLRLKHFQKILILSPHEFLKRLKD